MLRADLEALLPDRGVPLILVKANVCDLMELRLIADGFTVLNCGRRVPSRPGTTPRDFTQSLRHSSLLVLRRFDIFSPAAERQMNAILSLGSGDLGSLTHHAAG